MTRGTGIRLYACKGWPLHRHSKQDKGLSIGGVGYIVLGVHQEVKAVGGFQDRDLSRPMAGRVDEWYCLERISDGARRDVPVDQVRRFMKVEALNAMEVLARVKGGHGAMGSKEAREAEG